MAPCHVNMQVPERITHPPACCLVPLLQLTCCVAFSRSPVSLTLIDLGPGCIINHSSSIGVLSGFLVGVNHLDVARDRTPELGLGMAGDTGWIGGEVASQPCFVGCGNCFFEGVPSINMFWYCVSPGTWRTSPELSS